MGNYQTKEILMEKIKKNNTPVISARSLEAGYLLPKKQTKVILKDIHLDLYAGELLCLIGANGSGKSTLIKTLSGILKPLSGKVDIAGIDSAIYTSASLAKEISIVLTEKIETDNLSVRSLIALGRYPYTGILGKLSAEDECSIEWAVKVTGLSEFINKDIRDLSDGERQKVMIARALAQQTKLIFLDEPTAYLDMQNKYEIMALLRKLSREEGRSILLSTHDLDLALQFSDKICVLSSSGHAETGNPEDMILKGSLERIFDRGNTRFDMKSGRFVVPVLSTREIGLKGEEPLLGLTKKALEREGYGTTDSAERTIETLKVDGTYIWRILKKGLFIEFNSISALINYLRETEQ
jgi:iron complex transport system ATP-binding protein